MRGELKMKMVMIAALIAAPLSAAAHPARAADRPGEDSPAKGGETWLWPNAWGAWPPWQCSMPGTR